MTLVGRLKGAAGTGTVRPFVMTRASFAGGHRYVDRGQLGDMGSSDARCTR